MTYAPTLADLADILPGMSIPDAVRHNPDGEYQLILPRHIDEDGRPFVFDGGRHAMRMALPARAENYQVGPGDVLFMSRGERNRAAVIVACPAKSVAPAAFYILRSNPNRILPAFLAWYLNQIPAQAAIAQIRTGAGTPIVQRENFKSLTIAVPPMAQQRAIAQLGELMLFEQQLAARLADAVVRRNRAVGQSVIADLRVNRKD